MLRPVLFASLLTALAASSTPVSGQQMEDVVHLKNGSIVRGTIIEQIPGESLKMETQGAGEVVYTMDEVARISREPVEMSGRSVAGRDAEAPAQTDEQHETRPAPAVCLIGEHPGFPEAEARTAALLVRDELRRRDLPVGGPVYRAPDSASVYRVDLYRLGQNVLVRLSQEDPMGRVIVERQIQLGSIEEMIPAAPRLVEALVHRVTIASTADVESVVEEEARVLRKIPIQTSVEVGIFGTFGLGTGEDVGAKPGLKAAGAYERSSYALALEFAFAGEVELDGEEIESVEFGFLGLGGRYFLNKRSLSPYMGAGVTYVISKGWGNSLGGYAVGGIEALRLSQYGVRFELRVDKLFSDLPTRHAPVSLGVSLILPATPGRS